jgi:hypothetical protein
MLFIGSPGAIDPRAIASPSPADAGEGGKGGRGRACKPIPRGGTVGHLLAPLPGLFSGSK